MLYSVLCYNSVKQLGNSWIGLFSLVLLLNIQVKSSTYYVSPSSDDGWCPDIGMCFTLSEVTTIITDLNVSVILGPGNHSLASNFTVSGLEEFSLIQTESHSSVIINCGVSSRLLFSFTTYVHIKGITFSGCLDTEVRAVDKSIIENSTFLPASPSVYYGRALIVTSSTVIIFKSHFISFQAGMKNNGAIYSSDSNVLISHSTFVNNSAHNGGAVYCQDSKLWIKDSSFEGNGAQKGGVLYNKQNATEATDTLNFNSTLQEYLITWIHDSDSNVELLLRSSIGCIGSNFSRNTATSKGGVIYSETCSCSCMLYLDHSNFVFNVGNYGGVLSIRNFNEVTIHKSTFVNSKALRIGGVGYIFNSKVTVVQSLFHHNRAGRHAGALFFNYHAKVAIHSGTFYNNTASVIGGSVYLYGKSKILLTGLIIFKLNSAKYSAVINVYESDIVCNGSLIISNNNGSIATAHSKGNFAGNITFIDNKGSLYFFDSDVAIGGSLNSTQHNRFKKLDQDYTLEGGCLTLFISRVVISGTVTLTNNTATNGGGLLSITSRIILDKNGRLNVINNTAVDTGGGMYLYHSELYIRGPILVYGNVANKFGGGIHCISSTIVIIINRHNSHIRLESNTANSGGGICLEASSKFYVKRLSASLSTVAVKYINNSASFGGAIFVADNTTSGTCASSKVQSVTAASQSECFIQILRPITAIADYPHIGHVFLFTENFANTSGAKLYGGLLDRCTVNAFGKNIRYTNIPNSVESILNDTTSDPVRVCLCNPNSDVVSCSYTPKVKHFRKGNNLTLTLAAVDQLNHTVPATIRSSLFSRRGHLGDRQQAQYIEAACTDLNFSIFSPLNYSDKLYLYAEGPCNSLGISSLRIKIRFVPCRCPTGFEPVATIINRCVCGCHHILKTIFPFIRDSDCNSETLLLARSKDFWITTINETGTTFLSYQHCPSDYCHPSTSPVYIDFNTSNGPDAQCAFNHTGVLCGSCEPNFTLSLGSSHCIECPHLWPAVTVAFSIGVFLTGLCLVALMLALNLTVATGTLNGMIFYANVLATNRQFFMPFDHPTFHSALIAWLNLDIGFDLCYFKGLNAYAKAWLQIAFPVYIIVIVVAMILTSHYSRRFANLIARKNPVATLATLILLSYAKLLHSIIGILSYAIIRYTPLDGREPSTKMVWLRDGSMPYLKGMHILLFVVAVVIVVLGFIYTFLLLSWQWLVRFSNKAPFLWVRNTKLSSFMDAYHAPYMARNRYWTGLLLLARVILHLTAAIYVSGEPSVNLLCILLVIGSILLLHAYSGMSIYKKQLLNIFEFSTYFNILAFVAFKFYIQVIGGNHVTVAYISISIQMIILVCSMVHHANLEFRIIDKIKGTKWYKNQFNRNLCAPLLVPQVQYKPPSQAVTFSEVVMKKPDILMNSEIEPERDGLTMFSVESGDSEL